MMDPFLKFRTVVQVFQKKTSRVYYKKSTLLCLMQCNFVTLEWIRKKHPSVPWSVTIDQYYVLDFSHKWSWCEKLYCNRYTCCSDLSARHLYDTVFHINFLHVWKKNRSQLGHGIDQKRRLKRLMLFTKSLEVTRIVTLCKTQGSRLLCSNLLVWIFRQLFRIEKKKISQLVTWQSCSERIAKTHLVWLQTSSESWGVKLKLHPWCFLCNWQPMKPTKSNSFLKL